MEVCGKLIFHYKFGGTRSFPSAYTNKLQNSGIWCDQGLPLPLEHRPKQADRHTKKKKYHRDFRSFTLPRARVLDLGGKKQSPHVAVGHFGSWLCEYNEMLLEGQTMKARVSCSNELVSRVPSMPIMSFSVCVKTYDPFHTVFSHKRSASAIFDRDDTGFA